MFLDRSEVHFFDNIGSLSADLAIITSHLRTALPPKRAHVNVYQKTVLVRGC